MFNWLLNMICLKPKTVKFKKYSNEKNEDNSPAYFEWVYKCEQISKIDAKHILTDKAWKHCFEIGLTPEQAVQEYNRQKG